MKKLLLISALLLVSGAVQAEKDSDESAIARCLKQWKTHPFSAKDPSFTTLQQSTKVFGIGKSVKDTEKTDKPKLVLVKTGVSVLTKNVYELLNPNGWYCLKASVTVLGKVEFRAHCDAHLASATEDVTVLGANDNQGGTTVLGALRVTRVDCPATPAPKTEKSEKPTKK